MKTAKKLMIALSLLFMLRVAPLHAQADPARMERDIDVFEKVINELFKQNEGWYGFDRGSASGTYVPGYGVIVQLPAISAQLFSSGWGAVNVNEEVHKAIEESRKAIMESKKAIRESHKTIRDHHHQYKNKEIVVIGDGDLPVPPEPPALPGTTTTRTTVKITTNGNGKNMHTSYTYGPEKSDSMRQKKQQAILDKMKQVLQNYGDLLTQLAPGEKIMLVYDEHSAADKGYSVFTFNDGSGHVSTTAGSSQASPRMSAEVKKEDINAYRTGKMNAKAFSEHIKIETLKQKDEDFLEYKIFSGILETVFNHSDEAAFRVRGNISFTYLPGFGVIYQAAMRSSGREAAFFDNNGEGKKEEARTPKPDDALAASLKSSMLDYGRTLRSLKDDQYILLNISLPGEEDDQPSAISVKAKKEVLSKYEKGELSREKALEAISVNKN